MNSTQHAPIFDGYNDMLLRLHGLPSEQAIAAFIDGRADGHLNLPRMQAGGFAGGLFAVFVPSAGGRRIKDSQPGTGAYDNQLPAPMSQTQALPDVLSMVSLLHRLAEVSSGQFRICHTAADIRQAMADEAVAAVLHFEGAEAIDTDFRAMDVFVAAGLRSIGPVWSRPTAFGHGVPFRYPASPNTGDGLTAAGQALVRYCNTHRLAIDLSHLNGKGFWDVARLSNAPLIASHSNAHAVCPHARNLTDDQLRAVRDSHGRAGSTSPCRFCVPTGAILWIRV